MESSKSETTSYDGTNLLSSLFSWSTGLTGLRLTNLLPDTPFSFRKQAFGSTFARFTSVNSDFATCTESTHAFTSWPVDLSIEFTHPLKTTAPTASIESDWNSSYIVRSVI